MMFDKNEKHPINIFLYESQNDLEDAEQKN